MPRTYHKPWRLAFVVRIGRDAGMSERPYKVEQWSKDFAHVINVILETNDPKDAHAEFDRVVSAERSVQGRLVFPALR